MVYPGIFGDHGVFFNDHFGPVFPVTSGFLLKKEVVTGATLRKNIILNQRIKNISLKIKIHVYKKNYVNILLWTIWWS